MPFVKRTVEPVHLSDKPVPKCCRNELEAVSNVTLCGLIRQLACLADQANSIFDEIGIETKLVFERTNTLIFRVEKLKANVHNLDARSVKVPESNLDDYSVFHGHYHAPPAISKDLFTETTRPHCVKELRSAASTNFTDILRKCKEYQNDVLLVKSVMEMQWMSAQDHIDSQYELDVCKHVNHVLPKQRRKRTVFVNSPKGARPLSDGDIHEGYFVGTNVPLPTPEEVVRKNVLPSSVINIDVTGCSFQRMSSLRRSNGKKNIRSSLRRRTICVTPAGARVAPSNNEDYDSLPIVGLELSQEMSKTQSLDRNLILRRQSFNGGPFAVVQPIGTRGRPLSLRLQKRPQSLGKYETLPEGKHVDLHGNGTGTVIVRRGNKKEDVRRKGIRVSMPDHPDMPASCQSCETLPPYNSADSLDSSLEQGWAESSSPLRPKSMELDRKHLQVGNIPKSASAEHIKRSTTYSHNNIPKTNSSTMTEDVTSLHMTGAESGQLSTTTHPKSVSSNVKLRSSQRQDERQSSSGNWSESDSNRNSLQSDTNQSWISDASSSLISTCDSAVSMNCPEKTRSPEHGRSSSDVSQTSDSTLNAGSEEALFGISKTNGSSQAEVDFSITHMDTESWLQSVGAMKPVLEKAFGNQAPMQRHDYDPALLSDTCSSSLTSIDNFENSSELSDDLEMYLGQSGSEVFDSSNSLCSVDTDGYWTSMHSDCGLPSMSRRQTKYMPPSSIPIGYTSEESESGSRHSTRTPPRRTSPKMRLRKKRTGSPASDRAHHSPKVHSAEGSPNKDTDKGTKARPTSLKLPNSGALSPNSRSSSPGFSDTTSETSSYDLPEPMRTPTNGGLYTICFSGSMQLDDMIKCTSERTQDHTARSNSISSLSSAGYDDSPNNTLTRGSRTSIQTSTTAIDHPTHSDLWKQFGNRCEVELQKPESNPHGNQSSIPETSGEDLVSEVSTNTNQIGAVKEEDQSTHARKSYYDHRYGIFVVDTLDASECDDHLPSLPCDDYSNHLVGEMKDTCEIPAVENCAMTSDGKYLIKPTKTSISIPEPMKSTANNDGRLSPPKFVTPSPRLRRKTVMTTDLDRVLQWNETSCGQPVIMVTSKTNPQKTQEHSKPMTNQGATSQGENSANCTISSQGVLERKEPIGKSNDVWQRQQPDGNITETDIVWARQSPTQIRSNKVADKDKLDLSSPDGFGSEGNNTIKRSPRQNKLSSTTPQSTNLSSKDTSENIHVSIPAIDLVETIPNAEHGISLLQSSGHQVQRPTLLVNNNDSQKTINNSVLNVNTKTNWSSDVHIQSTGNEAAHQSPVASPVSDDYTLLDSPDSQSYQQLKSSLQNNMPAVHSTTHGGNQHHQSPLDSPVKVKNAQVVICHSDNQQKEPDVSKAVPITSKDTKQPSMVDMQLILPGNNQNSVETSNLSKSQNDSYIEFETSFGAMGEKMSVNIYSSPQQARRQDIFVQAEPSLQLISPVEKRAKNDSRNSFRNSYREELQNSNNDPDLAIIRAAGKIENGRQSSLPSGMITSTPVKGKMDSSSHRTSGDIGSINGFDASDYQSLPRVNELEIYSSRPNRNNSNHIEEGTESSPTQYVFDPNRQPTSSILKKKTGESDKSPKNSKERLSFLQVNKRKSNFKNDDLYRKAVMASLSNANGPFGSDGSINSSATSTRSISFSDTVIVDHIPVKVCQVSGKPQTSLADFRFLLQQQAPSSRTESAASALNVRSKNNRHNATELLVKTASKDRSQVNGFAEPAAGNNIIVMSEIRNVMEGSGNSDLKLPAPPSLHSPTEMVKRFPLLAVEELQGSFSRQSIPVPPPDATFKWLKGENASTPASDKPSPGPSRSLLMEEIRRQSGSGSRLVAINQIDQQLDKKLQTLPGDESDGGQPEFHGLFNSISTKVKSLPLTENVTESEHEYPTDAWD